MDTSAWVKKVKSAKATVIIEDGEPSLIYRNVGVILFTSYFEATRFAL